MKKTFLMEFDYLPDAEGIAESFGTTPNELATISLQMMELSCKNKIEKRSAALVEIIESGEITGGQVLALATMSLASTEKSAITHFLKVLMEGES